MKKLLFLILIMFLFSCEKDKDTSCWQCEIKVSYKSFHYNVTIKEKIMEIERCDLSEKEIKDYEKANNKIDITHIVDHDAIILLECKCKKQ